MLFLIFVPKWSIQLALISVVYLKSLIICDCLDSNKQSCCNQIGGWAQKRWEWNLINNTLMGIPTDPQTDGTCNHLINVSLELKCDEKISLLLYSALTERTKSLSSESSLRIIFSTDNESIRNISLSQIYHVKRLRERAHSLNYCAVKSRKRLHSVSLL